MSTAQKRYDIIRSLARYEDAHRRALKLALATSIQSEYGTPIRIDSPMFEIVRMYQKKIDKFRKDLKESE